VEDMSKTDWQQSSGSKEGGSDGYVTPPLTPKMEALTLHSSPSSRRSLSIEIPPPPPPLPPVNPFTPSGISLSNYSSSSPDYMSTPLSVISPISSPSPLLLAQQGEVPVLSLEKKKVLIIEDQIATSKILVKLFPNKYFSVDTAEDGAIAIGKLKQNRYDIVTSDINMPVMDGIECFLTMKALQASGELVNSPQLWIFNSSGNNEVRDKLLELKADAYIDKDSKETIKEKFKLVLSGIIEKKLTPEKAQLAQFMLDAFNPLLQRKNSSTSQLPLSPSAIKNVANSPRGDSIGRT
jgi:CheY-like chemotaxis protein